MLLDGGGRVIQEIRRGVLRRRLHVANGLFVACLVDVKAASASALEHAREYLEWTEHIAVCRGFQLDKTTGFGQVVAQRYQGALTREKRRRVGRKLTKGEKNECKREADAYKPPARPRFFDPLEWDRFVAPPGRRVPTRGARERRRARAEAAEDGSRSALPPRPRASAAATTTETSSSCAPRQSAAFHPRDAEELMCQGVKPRDDDARRCVGRALRPRRTTRFAIAAAYRPDARLAQENGCYKTRERDALASPPPPRPASAACSARRSSSALLARLLQVLVLLPQRVHVDARRRAHVPLNVVDGVRRSLLLPALRTNCRAGLRQRVDHARSSRGICGIPPSWNPASGTPSPASAASRAPAEAELLCAEGWRCGRHDGQEVGASTSPRARAK